MARLRHFAIVVRDLEKSAKFYESVFDLKRVGQETLDFASAVYLSDGVINLALLNDFGDRGSGLADAKNFVGATISVFRSKISPRHRSESRRRVAPSFSISAMMPRRKISSVSSRIPTGSSLTFPRKAGSALPADLTSISFSSF